MHGLRAYSLLLSLSRSTILAVVPFRSVPPVMARLESRLRMYVLTAVFVVYGI